MTQATVSLQATISLLLLSAAIVSRCYAVPIPASNPTEMTTLPSPISPSTTTLSSSSCAVTPDGTVIHDSTCIQEMFYDAALKLAIHNYNNGLSVRQVQLELIFIICLLHFFNGFVLCGIVCVQNWTDLLWCKDTTNAYSTISAWQCRAFGPFGGVVNKCQLLWLYLQNESHCDSISEPNSKNSYFKIDHRLCMHGNLWNGKLWVVLISFAFKLTWLCL